jgi:hypothetical protein
VPPPPGARPARRTRPLTTRQGVGRDGVTTPTLRSPDQTETGIYWAYDGTPSLCAPPRLYNQIAVHIADQMGTAASSSRGCSRSSNVAMADAGIAIWESKYHYDFWRPVTGIRESGSRPGPTGSATAIRTRSATDLLAARRSPRATSSR